MNQIRVTVIFVQYDTNKYPDSFDKFRRKVELNIDENNIEVNYVVVDNSLDLKVEKKNSNNLYFISGDNKEWEFSGWDRGISYVTANLPMPDVFHFANDAWFAYGWTLLDQIAIQDIASSIRRLPFQIVGQVDSKGYPMHLMDLDVSEWICTNNYFTSPIAYSMLGKLTSFTSENLGEIVPQIYERGVYFKESSALSVSYKDMILNWLLKEWHGKFEPNEVSWPVFRMKILAMLNESMLTARARIAGCKITHYGSLRKGRHVWL